MHAHADVATELASRYLQQLCRHFAHKIPAPHTTDEGRIEFPSGLCLLKAEGDTLRIDIEAGAEDDLNRLKDVVASHLARFAFRDPPQVRWDA